MSLIDFGACREYRKDFVDDYLKLVWSAANRDDAEIMRVGIVCTWKYLFTSPLTLPRQEQSKLNSQIVGTILNRYDIQQMLLLVSL